MSFEDPTPPRWTWTDTGTEISEAVMRTNGGNRISVTVPVPVYSTNRRV
jgi:hypothetical protein